MVRLLFVPLKIYVMCYFKVEGDMIFDDNKTVLTWGPFYYHLKENAIARMSDIFNDIINWANYKDPSLNIKATDIVETKSKTMKCFKCKAWKTETSLQDVGCIIKVDEIFFEDE